MLFPQGTLLVLPNSDALLSSDTATSDLISMLHTAKGGGIECVLKLHAETVETVNSLKITSLRAKKSAELIAKRTQNSVIFRTEIANTLTWYS